ncbi:MAG TPA: hypothetical protein VK324_07225 [Tepidisphaeraceae bacterium]|nr:hypothetical protein [Tepidisphaeraceae bacterium]
MIEWFERQFPSAVGRYAKTSDEDEEYNCIAWAATGEKSEWWSHGPGYKWPAANRSPLVGSLVAVFLGLGFEERPPEDTAVEPGFEKVALYARHGMWKHAARQKTDGKWTSKLGPDEDIDHDSPECLCGDSYGVVHCIMRRARG